MNTLKSTFVISVALAGFLSWSGCSGSSSPPTPANQTAEQTSTAPFDLEVVKVEQLNQIGTHRSEGGKYVAVTFDIENISNGDISLKPQEFAIRNITDKPQEQYQQAAELWIGKDFLLQFGPERGSKYMGNLCYVHPKFKVQRSLVFELPSDALPEKYELYHAPLKVAFPLVGDNTEMVDMTLISPTTTVSPTEAAPKTPSAP